MRGDDLALILGDDDQGDWQEQALCAQTDPGAFFPEKGESTMSARRICGLCPVRARCLEVALETDERHGIWAGTQPGTRIGMRRDWLAGVPTTVLLARLDRRRARRGTDDPDVDVETPDAGTT